MEKIGNSKINYIYTYLLKYIILLKEKINNIKSLIESSSKSNVSLSEIEKLKEQYKYLSSEYNFIIKILNNIKNISNEEDFNEYMSKISSISKSSLDLYTETKSKYPSKLTSSQVKELDILKRKSDIPIKAIELLKNGIKSYEAKSIDSKENSELINKFVELSKRIFIINLKYRYCKNKDLKERYLQELADLGEKREALISFINPQFDIDSGLEELESHEKTAIISYGYKPREPYKMSSEEIIKRYKKITSAIRDLKTFGGSSVTFASIHKKESIVPEEIDSFVERDYLYLSRERFDIVKSISNGDKDLLENLDEISWLENFYNSRLSYESFKDKFRGGFIGGEKVSPELLKSGVEYLRDVDSTIDSQLQSKLSKVKEVVIKSDIPLFDEQKKLIESKYYEFAQKLIESRSVNNDEGVKL